MATAVDFLAAFKKWWDGSSLANPYGGPFREQAPDIAQNTFPYVVFATISHTRTDTTNSSEFWRYLFQLAVYDRDAELVDKHVAVIRAAVGAATFALDSGDGSVLKCRCVSEIVVMDDRRVWNGVLGYEVVRQQGKLD